MTKTTRSAARLLLAKQRQMTSLLDKEIIAESADMVFRKSQSVVFYYDRGNAVTSDCGQKRAFKAVSLKGEILWFVQTPQVPQGQPIFTSDPHDAMDQARARSKQTPKERADLRSLFRRERNVLAVE